MKSVVRWNPIRDFASVQDEMNRLMGDVFGRPLDQGGAVVWQPPIDIEETPESYRVHVELPGMRLEDSLDGFSATELLENYINSTVYDALRAPRPTPARRPGSRRTRRRATGSRP